MHYMIGYFGERRWKRLGTGCEEISTRPHRDKVGNLDGLGDQSGKDAGSGSEGKRKSFVMAVSSDGYQSLQIVKENLHPTQ
jgi:hypothetical protein